MCCGNILELSPEPFGPIGHTGYTTRLWDLLQVPSVPCNYLSFDYIQLNRKVQPSLNAADPLNIDNFELSWTAHLWNNVSGTRFHNYSTGTAKTVQINADAKSALLSAFNKILHPTQVSQVKGRGGFNTYLFGRVWFLFKTDNPHKVNQNVRIDLNLFFNFFFLSSNLRFHLKNNTSC